MEPTLIQGPRDLGLLLSLQGELALGSQGLLWHCHDNSSSQASCFRHLLADGSARQLSKSKLTFSMPVVRLGFRKAEVESWLGLGLSQGSKAPVIRSAGFQQRNTCSAP